MSFLLVAAVMFWLVIRPVNRLMSMRRTEEPVAETTRECPQCLSQIPIAAHRCAFCTSQLD